jgi:hypothetical protein
MSTRSRALVALAVALVPSACGHLPLPGAGSSEAVPRPVALLAEGSAFTDSVRAATVREVERALHRPVRIIDAMPGPADTDTKALAARLVSERAAIARYDWREPHCAADRAVLTGVARGVHAVYRAALEYAERERPATDEEWTLLGQTRVGFRRLRARPAVRVEVLSGAVDRVVFVAKDAAARASLQRRRVTLATDPRRLDAAAAVAEAIAALGAVPPPDWDGVARRLVRTGCPFLALGVADTQLVGSAAREPVQTAALAAMRATVDRRTARQRAEDTAERARAAIREGNVERGAAMLAEYEASAERQPATVQELGEALAAARSAPDAAPAADAVTSCRALCEMHMVEICNADKVLWSAHRARWEPTPCGIRREEPFLAQCYREQWETGTFETSCVQPCESSDEGRTRLMAILQDAGCVAGPGPS